jgi:ribosomal protein S18 acetylase RimI-like enzyme
VTDGTSLLHSELVDAFAALLSSHPEATFEQRDGYVFVSYPRAPLPAMNGVWSGNDDVSAAAALEGELERVRATGIPPGVTVLDGEAPRLLAEARRLGLTETLPLPGMTTWPDRFRPVEIDSAEIEVVDDEEALAEACAVLADGFGVPVEWFRDIYRPEGLGGGVVYLLRENGRPASTAVSYQGRSGLGIFNVATSEQWRGRGYGAAVTSRAVSDGFAAGADFAYLQASAMGEPVYRRLGFEQVSTYTLAYARAG